MVLSNAGGQSSTNHSIKMYIPKYLIKILASVKF